MAKGGIVMDVVNAEQAKIAEAAGVSASIHINCYHWGQGSGARVGVKGLLSILLTFSEQMYLFNFLLVLMPDGFIFTYQPGKSSKGNFIIFS